MIIEVKTIYRNVDQEFLSIYLDRLRTEPELVSVADNLLRDYFAVFESKDPDGKCSAKTTYSITFDDVMYPC